MMTRRLPLLGASLVASSLSLVFSFSLFACAGDPARQADDAREAQLKAERQQVELTSAERSAGRVKAAEAQRNATEGSQPAATTGSAISADAKLTEARDVYRAKATERLEKADARTAELKGRVEKAGGKASTASRDALKTIETQRSLVTRELDRLPNIANDDFSAAKTSLDTQLDNLDGLVKKAADEVDKFKK